VGGFGERPGLLEQHRLPLRPASTVILNDTVVRTTSPHRRRLLWRDDVCAGQTCTDAAATKASLSLTSSLVDNNTATKQAGGVYATRSTVTVSGGLVSRNRNNAGDGFGRSCSSAHERHPDGRSRGANEASQFGAASSST